MPTPLQAPEKSRLRCPFCGEAARIRTSRPITPLYRDGIVECQNIEHCGWRGRYSVELLATLTPSAKSDSTTPAPLPETPYLLPDAAVALPVRARPKTKNPNDPDRDQLDIFKR
ncbi:ogr/Delta-like zinc finger family protein [Marinimicrobium sp. ARAG 43.8]|uniref:ogr/Delta-like zinc finger family protein n=1 Tax=Marinimicrobium sp. ARAG 43.8 TaxID=3418719 RepID=UPI003CFBBD77